jgi:tRNA A-37 threonylcarbamoyl transferase component Bud32
MDVSAIAPFSNVECPSCGEKNRVKTEFGHYTLKRRLAEGGMSLVFVATDNTLGREVALKILNEEYSADKKRIAAFEEEARITASFSHPHVVRVFTTGRAFDRFYIAMELVPGGHFEHQIRERGRIPELEILPFAVQVAEGLEAARAAGLIHRDVKPGNILLDSQGNAKIVDFGLALITKDGRAKAQEIWATPYYVPPETIEGHAEDFRSDLYAFGATLYHALAGKPPCNEESMKTDVLREAKKHVKALHFAAPDISSDTCEIIDRAMAYDPQARFESYEEMIKQLKASLARLKKGGAETAGAKQKRRAMARRGEWIAMGAAAALLLGAIGGGVAWVFRKDPRKPDVAQSTILQTPDIAQDDNSATASLIGRRYREARDAVSTGDYEKARLAFASLRDDPEVQEPTRSWAAVEAVVVSYLDGRGADAKKEAKLATTHIHSTDLAEQKLGERLLATLERLDEIVPVKRRKAEATGDDATWALVMMLGGLKNWEQGLTKQAADDFFRPVVSARFTSKDQWVISYQKIAERYLNDQQRLSDPIFDEVPATKEACVAISGKLDQLLPKLETKGRAKFNVRAFQLDVKRQLKLLDAPPVPSTPSEPKLADGRQVTFFEPTVPDAVPVPAPDSPTMPAVDPIARFDELTKACKFEEAAEYLKSLTAEPPGATRESLLSISAAASSFLGFLEEDMNRSPDPVQLKLRSGATLENIKVPKQGRLVSSTDGAEHEWGEIDPESVIYLYRMAARNRVAEIDKLQRHESAIAYDWLVGDRNRAKLAAERLSTDSEVFKRRWDSLASGLPN